MPVPLFHLRAATADDTERVYAITRDAMRGFVEQTWGCWDEAEQRRRHGESFTPSKHRIVDIGGVAAGFIAVEILPVHVSLVKLYLLAAVRGQGIGSALLAQIMGEADARGRPMRLRVLRVNTRAQALYARYGFCVVEQTPQRLVMERPVHPSSA
jgi:ribosomal protein S18 acetylase RimI-like enzyme